MLLGRLRRRRGHLVMHVMHVVMMVVVVVVVVVVMMHRLGHRSGGLGGGGRRGFLRDGVAGEADGERGGSDKALDHGKTVLSRKTQSGLRAESYRALTEPGMNRGGARDMRAELLRIDAPARRAW
jgi:hypothetical protein